MSNSPKKSGGFCQAVPLFFSKTKNPLFLRSRSRFLDQNVFVPAFESLFLMQPVIKGREAFRQAYGIIRAASFSPPAPVSEVREHDYTLSYQIPYFPLSIFTQRPGSISASQLRTSIR